MTSKSKNSPISVVFGKAPTRMMWLFSACVAIAGAGSAYTLLSQGKSVDLVPPKTPPDQILNVLKNLTPEQREKLNTSIQNDIRQNPLDLAPVLKLAALASTEGNQQRGDELTLQAAERSHLNPKIQLAALQLELKKNDYTASLDRIDALLKTTPEITRDLFQTMASFTGQPDSLKAIVAKLAERPTWRTSFLLTLAANQNITPQILYALFSELRHTQAPESQEELHGALQRMIQDKDYDKAYFMWVDSLGDIELRKAAAVFDGGFELPAGNQFYSWTILDSPNVETRLTPRAPSSTDMVLRVDFVPARTVYNHLSQMIRLSPGDYTLSGEQKAENLQSTNGMVWRVYCVNDSRNKIGESPRLAGTQQWSRFTTAFTVPETDCPQQTLRLDLDAPTGLDAQVSGSVSYDNLAIEPKIVESGG